MLHRLGLPATESVESEELCRPKFVSGVICLRGVAWRFGPCSVGEAAALVTATASFAARRMAAACGLCGD